jgi:peroxidase
LFRYRLYNFTSSGNADPTINSANLRQLQSVCPVDGDGSKGVALDKGSETNFDASFFKNIRDGNGVLESDQRLWSDESTKMYVQRYAGTIRGLLGLRFDVAFAKAMEKMSNIGVKTGMQGEVRKLCSAFNA